MAAPRKTTKTTAEKAEPVEPTIVEDDYKKEIAELKAQIALLVQNAAANQQIQPVQENLNDPDRDILVVSLTRGLLNLSTKGHGHGEVYRFNDFGDDQMIPYGDLKEIIRSNKKFTTNGNFYICDETVIEKQRLKKAYEKIVSKEQFDSLFTEKKDKFIKLFDKMTTSQQLIFSDILTDKLVNDEDVDANIVRLVADKTGKKVDEIYKTVEIRKKSKEIAKE